MAVETPVELAAEAREVCPKVSSSSPSSSLLCHISFNFKQSLLLLQLTPGSP